MCVSMGCRRHRGRILNNNIISIYFRHPPHSLHPSIRVTATIPPISALIPLIEHTIRIMVSPRLSMGKDVPIASAILHAPIAHTVRVLPFSRIALMKSTLETAPEAFEAAGAETGFMTAAVFVVDVARHAAGGRFFAWTPVSGRKNDVSDATWLSERRDMRL
jgi:hypothetical protein